MDGAGSSRGDGGGGGGGGGGVTGGGYPRCDLSGRAERVRGGGNCECLVCWVYGGCVAVCGDSG